MIGVKIFDPPEWNVREIMRYAHIRGADESYRDLIDECMAEAESALSYRVCYLFSDICREEDRLSFSGVSVSSATLSKALKDADRLLLFAATVGAPFDRLIQRYSRLSPSKALIFQAIGAERVESLCDAFCAGINASLCADDMKLTTRVSPGYGDIALDMQRDIFALLDCPRKIGLTLDESLLMSPSKSVTAICGVIGSDRATDTNKCGSCGSIDCPYRTEDDLWNSENT